MHQLQQKLLRIDGKGYKAYKDIQGTYRSSDYMLHIDYVQGDPFASPSRIRIQMKQDQLAIDSEYYTTPTRRTATEDFFARQVAAAIDKVDTSRRGSGKSGAILVDRPGQEVLPRTAVVMNDKYAEVRLSIGLPARGRRILGKQAWTMFADQIPTIIRHAFQHFNRQRLERHGQLADQQEAIRHYLKQNGYIAFVANGAVLPRQSGVSNRPLTGANIVPFQSPPSMEVEIPLPHRKPIRGMAIQEGITLIVGGGYHGKSTLLKAIERGVYNHIPGDGREYVISEHSATKIRAEDGRRVEKVNIRPFISNLPFGQDTTRFSSDDASGSTSQSANIMEALEIGSRVFLIDEDTSATNFMIRDARMQHLVAKGKEPITPFVDKVRQLYDDYGVSTVLVIGGSGDYFDVADHVIMLDEYCPQDVTKEAQQVARSIENQRQKEGGGRFGEYAARRIHRRSFQARKGRKEKVDAKGLHTIMYGTESIDLSVVEQIVDRSQTRAIANMIHYVAKHFVDDKRSLHELMDLLYRDIEERGLDVVSPFYGTHPGDMALPRKMEVAAAINRLRSLHIGEE